MRQVAGALYNLFAKNVSKNAATARSPLERGIGGDPSSSGRPGELTERMLSLREPTMSSASADWVMEVTSGYIFTELVKSSVWTVAGASEHLRLATCVTGGVGAGDSASAEGACVAGDTVLADASAIGGS